MDAFEYVRAASLDETLAELAKAPDDTRLLAGGTDLLVFMMERRLTPRRLIDIKHLPELQGCESNGTLRLGSLTTMRTLERDAAVRRDYGALADGAAWVGGMQIRNRATVGGNLATASPAADTPPALLAHDARVTLRGVTGTRTVPLAEFFIGPGNTVLERGEVIESLHLPASAERSGSRYLKLAGRHANDIAFVGVAAYVALADDGTVTEAALGLGAVAPTPVRVDLTELLAGERLTPAALDAAAVAARAASSPISDVRCSADYRLHMVGVLTQRALAQAAERADSRQPAEVEA